MSERKAEQRWEEQGAAEEILENDGIICHRNIQGRLDVHALKTTACTRQTVWWTTTRNPRGRPPSFLSREEMRIALLKQKPSSMTIFLGWSFFWVAFPTKWSVRVSGFCGEHTGVLDLDAAYRNHAVLMGEHVSGILVRRTHRVHNL
jgi:hypothetical protein